jgi:hypothetical protein
MSRPTVEVADLIHAKGEQFINQHRRHLSYQQLKVLRAIAQCRTAALGGHIDDCSRCGHKAISYNSCRNRHCPRCQAQARQRWLAAREKEVLGVPYFHVVFTLPHALIPLCQRNPRVLYDLLFQASAATMQELAADPKHLGAQIGLLSILHTWGQNLLPHPHMHCAIPAGGLSPDQTRWVRPKYPFFLPVKALSRVFRGKFVNASSAPFAGTNCNFLKPTQRLFSPDTSGDSFVLCSGRTGLYMRSPLSAALRRCCAIWAATPTVLPSAIIVCWLSTVSESPSAGRTTRTATSSGR